MPRKSTAEEEIDELVDELDELEDEEEPAAEEEWVDEVETDDEEDPDEPPKRTRRKGKAKKAKAERDGIGTTELADAAGIDSRSLRQFLRAKGIQPRDDSEGVRRYNWKSLQDPQARSILKAIREGEQKRLNKDRLAELKGKSAAKKAATKSPAKRTAAKKTATRRKK